MRTLNFLGSKSRFIPAVRKLCSQASNDNILSAVLLDHKIQFSEDTSNKILEAMNQSAPEDLAKYEISNDNIKNLIDWKNEKGPFKTLSDPLEVQGFDVPMILDFYKSVAFIKVTKMRKSKMQGSMYEKHLLRPELNPNVINSLQSAVAIHLDPIGISWVRLDKSSKITSWNCEKFSSLPNKMLASDTFNLAVSLTKKTPRGDVYIFESPISLSPQSKAKQEVVTSYSQHLELLSMLMALLNTSSVHNSGQYLVDHKIPVDNKVFHLKNRITARLFGTLIGSERVSAIPLVTSVVKGEIDSRKFPCAHVEIDSGMASYYLKENSVHKEILSKSLMLGVAFMNLCILRNPSAFEALKSTQFEKRMINKT